MGMDKVRRNIIAARDRLTSQELEARSREIMAALFRLPEFMAARTVMFYASFRSEVRTPAAIEKSLAVGKRVAIPLSQPDERLLLPYLISDPFRQLKPGYCSIPEPDPAAAIAVEAGAIDVVIVPGSVFDRGGGRLGYGGGFYDRFLAGAAKGAFRVAVAFDLQVVAEELLLAPHDQKMDCLVTDKELLRFKSPG